MQWLRTFRSAHKQSSHSKARRPRAVVIQELRDRQGDLVAATVTDAATDEVLHRAVGPREAFDWIAAAASARGVRTTSGPPRSISTPRGWARERGSQRSHLEAARQAASRASAA
jgi:hypothetical protein